MSEQALASALLQFQKDAPSIQRDAINPHFRNKYVSLETLMGHVLPIANQCGLVIQQWPTVVENGEGPKPALRTRITHAESGEFAEDTMLLQASKDDPQGQGSAITYARRYSLMAALGLVADEDDDGNAATKSAGGPSTAREPGRRAAAERTDGESAPAAPPAEAGDFVLTFGKHKGQMLKDVPEGYLEWLLTKFEAKTEDQHAVLNAVAAFVMPGSRVTFPDDDIPF